MFVKLDKRAIALGLLLCRRPACNSCGFGVEGFVRRSFERVSGGVVVEERRLDAHDYRRSTLDGNERMCAQGKEQGVICEWNARRRSRPGLSGSGFAESSSDVYSVRR